MKTIEWVLIIGAIVVGVLVMTGELKPLIDKVRGMQQGPLPQANPNGIVNRTIPISAKIKMPRLQQIDYLLPHGGYAISVNVPM